MVHVVRKKYHHLVADHLSIMDHTCIMDDMVIMDTGGILIPICIMATMATMDIMEDMVTNTMGHMAMVIISATAMTNTIMDVLKMSLDHALVLGSDLDMEEKNSEGETGSGEPQKVVENARKKMTLW
ncbi:unnamed protein product, partial [Brenthis ino]